MAASISKQGGPDAYTQPKDRKGHLAKDMLSTEQLESALEDYRQACEEAHQAVIRQLKALAQQLEVQPLQVPI